MSVQLQVILGKERGKFLAFPQGEFVFGRGPECHIRPNSELVSRQHCMIAVTDDSISIRDLGSTNGTLVNGVRVRGELLLNDGDRIQVGPVVLQVQLPRDVAVDETIAGSLQDAATIMDTNLVGNSQRTSSVQ